MAALLFQFIDLLVDRGRDICAGLFRNYRREIEHLVPYSIKIMSDDSNRESIDCVFEETDSAHIIMNTMLYAVFKLHIDHGSFSVVYNHVNSDEQKTVESHWNCDVLNRNNIDYDSQIERSKMLKIEYNSSYKSLSAKLKKIAEDRMQNGVKKNFVKLIAAWDNARDALYKEMMDDKRILNVFPGSKVIKPYLNAYYQVLQAVSFLFTQEKISLFTQEDQLILEELIWIDSTVTGQVVNNNNSSIDSKEIDAIESYYVSVYNPIVLHILLHTYDFLEQYIGLTNNREQIWIKQFSETTAPDRAIYYAFDELVKMKIHAIFHQEAYCHGDEYTLAPNTFIDEADQSFIHLFKLYKVNDMTSRHDIHPFYITEKILAYNKDYVTESEEAPQLLLVGEGLEKKKDIFERWINEYIENDDTQRNNKWHVDIYPGLDNLEDSTCNKLVSKKFWEDNLKKYNLIFVLDINAIYVDLPIKLQDKYSNYMKRLSDNQGLSQLASYEKDGITPFTKMDFAPEQSLFMNAINYLMEFNNSLCDRKKGYTTIKQADYDLLSALQIWMNPYSKTEKSRIVYFYVSSSIDKSRLDDYLVRGINVSRKEIYSMTPIHIFQLASHKDKKTSEENKPCVIEGISSKNNESIDIDLWQIIKPFDDITRLEDQYNRDVDKNDEQNEIPGNSMWAIRAELITEYDAKEWMQFLRKVYIRIELPQPHGKDNAESSYLEPITYAITAKNCDNLTIHNREKLEGFVYDFISRAFNSFWKETISKDKADEKPINTVYYFLYNTLHEIVSISMLGRAQTFKDLVFIEIFNKKPWLLYLMENEKEIAEQEQDPEYTPYPLGRMFFARVISQFDNQYFNNYSEGYSRRLANAAQSNGAAVKYDADDDSFEWTEKGKRSCYGKVCKYVCCACKGLGYQNSAIYKNAHESM